MNAGQKAGWANEIAKKIGVLALVIAGGAMVSPVAAQSVASATQSDASVSPSWAKRTFGHMEWAEVAHQYATPREICRLVEKNVRYKTESVDAWTGAEQTWVNGRGDCEDFAILIQELCRLSGIETKVHLYFPATGGREGHAVLVGTWNGKIWFSSNGSYEEVKSEDEVRHRVARLLSCKEKQLWVMKLNDRDVANYVEKAPARAVASR